MERNKSWRMRHFLFEKDSKAFRGEEFAHPFDRSLNLLEKIECDQLSNRLKNALKSEKNFMEWLNSATKMTT